MKAKTEAEIFIIESLEFDDEKEQFYEGALISEMLRLSGKTCKYIYIRTKKELIKVLDHFWESKYRYLHFSCHANNEEMCTTLDHIPFAELGKILEHYLENRRLFLSACEMSCDALAKELIPRTKCYSILGPAQKPFMSDAAVFWVAFYHRMFRLNSNSMNLGRLVRTATALSSAFDIPLNLYHPHQDTYKHCPIMSRIPAVCEMKPVSHRKRQKVKRLAGATQSSK